MGRPAQKPAKKQQTSSAAASYNKTSEESSSTGMVVVSIVVLIAAVGGFFAMKGAALDGGNNDEKDNQDHYSSRRPADGVSPLDISSTSAETFTCGTILKLVQQENGETTTVVDNAAEKLRQKKVAEEAAAAAKKGGAAPTPVTIGASQVNDNYCDCPDGTDEISTSACSRQMAIKNNDVAFFTCVMDPLTRVPLSRVDDGVEDCCDGSDEPQSAKKKTPTSHEEKCKSVKQARVEELEKNVEKIRQGNTIRNELYIPNGTEQMEAMSAQLEKAREQGNAQIEQYNAAVSEFQAIPESEQGKKAQRLQYLQKFQNHLNQMMRQIETQTNMINTGALGEHKEFMPLVNACFNKTVHEKKFRGGSAEPEQFNVTFTVCPFGYVLQRREPDTSSPVEADKKKSEEKEEEAPKPTLLGVWTNVVVADAKDNSISALDTYGAMTSTAIKETKAYRTNQRRIRRASKTKTWKEMSKEEREEERRALQLPGMASSTPIHLFTGGEDCWQGPPRTVKLIYTCSTKDEILRIFENGKCRYEVSFGSPAACTDAMLRGAEMELSEALKVL